MQLAVVYTTFCAKWNVLPCYSSKQTPEPSLNVPPLAEKCIQVEVLTLQSEKCVWKLKHKKA